MDWLSVAMEEYKTLRAESIESMKMQQSILQYGAATMGIIIIGGFNVWNNPFLPEIVFLFILPAVVYLVSIIWIGEVARMFRAGSFLSELEKKINSEFTEKGEVLSWESWLRKKQADGKTPHQLVSSHYIAIYCFFSIISIASIVIGNLKLWKTVSTCYITAIDTIEAISFVVIVIMAQRILKKIKSIDKNAAQQIHPAAR
jgi:hypothetical protein